MNPVNDVAARLAAGQRFKVLFINDTGFIGGAGVAHRRQIQSFLLGGHDVAAICWLENPSPQLLPPLGGEFVGAWLGLRSFPEIHVERGLAEGEIVARLLSIVRGFEPHLVVCGNLHWAKWPLRLLQAIQGVGIQCISYLHDCHWLTGRCAYTGGCRKYLTGCDASCPTSNEYPPALPETIADAWRMRREVFCGEAGVPLFANSQWMKAMADGAFHHQASVSVVPLGLDARLFSPINRRLARRLLKLPEEGTLVLAGAVNLKENRKSGPLFEEVLAKIHAAGRAKVVAFGYGSESFPGVIGLGPIQDERKMAVLFNAADVMMHTAREESFGQTLMEASACGVPVVAFASGGMVDIAKLGVNALTIPENEPERYFETVDTLTREEELRAAMGAAGRALVERCFTLEHQYDSWRRNLQQWQDRQTNQVVNEA